MMQSLLAKSYAASSATHQYGTYITKREKAISYFLTSFTRQALALSFQHLLIQQGDVRDNL